MHDDHKHTGYLGPQKSEPMPERDTGPLDDVLPWVIELRVVGTPIILRMPLDQSEVLLGRADPEHQIVPELDLTEYSGIQRGVSRRHARIIVQDNRVTIEDLGSANGTYINGRFLIQGQQYRVRSGDVLRLGYLELQVHFVMKPSTDERTMVGRSQMPQIPRIAANERLLVLDDQPDVCRLIEYVAVRAGFQVIIASSVGEAIQAIDTWKPHLLVIELVLSEGDGLDVVRYVREHQQEPRAQILAMTTSTGGFSIGQALTQGVDLVLAKPVAIDELVLALDKMMTYRTGSS